MLMQRPVRCLFYVCVKCNYPFNLKMLLPGMNRSSFMKRNFKNRQKGNYVYLAVLQANKSLQVDMRLLKMLVIGGEYIASRF